MYFPDVIGIFNVGFKMYVTWTSLFFCVITVILASKAYHEFKSGIVGEWASTWLPSIFT